MLHGMILGAQHSEKSRLSVQNAKSKLLCLSMAMS